MLKKTDIAKTGKNIKRFINWGLYSGKRPEFTRIIIVKRRARIAEKITSSKLRKRKFLLNMFLTITYIEAIKAKKLMKNIE